MKKSVNWYKRYLGWFWKHKIISAIVIVVIIIIAAAASSNNTSTKTPQSTKPAATTEKSVVPTQSSYLAGNAHPQFPAGHEQLPHRPGATHLPQGGAPEGRRTRCARS